MTEIIMVRTKCFFFTIEVSGGEIYREKKDNKIVSVKRDVVGRTHGFSYQSYLPSQHRFCHFESCVDA
jgi:hypothetical protein